MSQDLDLDIELAPLPAVLPVDEPDSAALPLPQPDDLRPEGFTLPQPIDDPLTPQSFTSVPFANLPLYLPTLTNPVVGYNGGLNAAALEVAGKGVICILLPYLEQADGDFIALLHNGVRVDFHTVTDDEASNGKQIVLHIPSERFINQASNSLQAFVTRIGGGSDQTAQFNIFVDKDRPGGPNPRPSTEPNDNLPLPRFPQNIIDFGVDKDSASQPIPVQIDFYPLDRSLPTTHYRKVRDRIRLSVGGIIVEHIVTEFEAASEDPITVNINPGVWTQTGSGVKRCEYNVVDEVGNLSQGFSPAQDLDVRLDNSTEPFLPAAFIFESEDDGTGNDFLDYDALAGADATIAVSVRSMGYQANDIIRVRINGLTQDGVRIIKVYDFPVTSTTVMFAFIDWPNADIQPLVGGRIQITYQRVRTGAPARNSESTLVAIKGTPIDTGLPAPLVVDAIGGVLPPTIDPVLVKVFSYTGQLPNDRVTLIVEGTYANGRPYYAEYSDRAGNGDIYFEIPNGPDGDIAQLQGGRATFYYLINNGAERPRSNATTVDVGDFQASLPAPVPRQAPPPDYVFDPEISKGNLNVTVTRHAAFVEGATVTLYFEGSMAGGSAPPDRFPIDSSWVGQDLPFTVPRVYVVANLNGTGKLYYTVEVPGQRTLISHEIMLKVGSALSLPVAQVLEGTVISPTLTRLNPEHVLPPRPPVVTFRVSYSPMLPSDNVKLRVIGRPGLGTPDIAAKPGVPQPGENYISFTASNRFIGANLGSNCQVFYEVERDGAITTSDVLTLEVQALPALELDLVRIPEAVGGVVETNKTYTVRVDGWPFMEQGQAVWIDLLSSENLALRIGTVVSDAEFSARRIQMTIPADYLRTLRDADMLRVEVRVSLDGTGDKSLALALVVPPVYRIKRVSGVIVGSITVGNSPTTLTLSPDNRLLYVTNALSLSVSIVNTETLKVIKTFEYQGYQIPVDVAVHPSRPIFYIGIQERHISVIDSDSYELITNITGFNPPTSLAINPSGSRLYTTDTYNARLLEINTNTNTVTGSVSSRNLPHVATLNKLGTRIYMAGASGVSLSDQATGTILSSIGLEGTAQGIAHNSSNETLYVAATTIEKLAFYNTSSDTLSLIQLTTLLGRPWKVVLNPTSPRAYISLNSGNAVAVLDTDTRLLLEEQTITGFDQPKGIAVTSDGTRMYVANAGGDSVSVVDI